MSLPKWDELPEDEQKMLIGYASTFGIGQNLVMPDEKEAWCIAVEMYAAVRDLSDRLTQARTN